MSYYITLQVGDEIESCPDCLLNMQLVQSTDVAYLFQLLICNRYPGMTTYSLSFCFVKVWQPNTVKDTLKKPFLKREIQWQFCGVCTDVVYPSNFEWRSGFHMLIKSLSPSAFSTSYVIHWQVFTESENLI